MYPSLPALKTLRDLFFHEISVPYCRIVRFVDELIGANILKYFFEITTYFIIIRETSIRNISEACYSISYAESSLSSYSIILINRYPSI